MTMLRSGFSARALRRAGAALTVGTALLALTACSSAATVADTSWGTLDTRGEPSLTFSASGTVHGSDGCNVINGSWSEEGGTVTFGPLATTMMYCEGVDTWLSGASTATVSGDTLTVSDAEGKPLGTLAKTTFVEPK